MLHKATLIRPHDLGYPLGTVFESPKYKLERLHSGQLRITQGGISEIFPASHWYGIEHHPEAKKASNSAQLPLELKTEEPVLKSEFSKVVKWTSSYKRMLRDLLKRVWLDKAVAQTEGQIREMLSCLVGIHVNTEDPNFIKFLRDSEYFFKKNGSTAETPTYLLALDLKPELRSKVLLQLIKYGATTARKMADRIGRDNFCLDEVRTQLNLLKKSKLVSKSKEGQWSLTDTGISAAKVAANPNAASQAAADAIEMTFRGLS